LKNNVISRRGREKYTHFEIGGHGIWQRVIPRHKVRVCLVGLWLLQKLLWPVALKKAAVRSMV
jgi:hypothetical protein